MTLLEYQSKAEEEQYLKELMIISSFLVKKQRKKNQKWSRKAIGTNSTHKPLETTQK